MLECWNALYICKCMKCTYVQACNEEFVAIVTVMYVRVCGVCGGGGGGGGVCVCVGCVCACVYSVHVLWSTETTLRDLRMKVVFRKRWSQIKVEQCGDVYALVTSIVSFTRSAIFHEGFLSKWDNIISTYIHME